MKKYLLISLLFSMACANVSAAAEVAPAAQEEHIKAVDSLVSVLSAGTLRRLVMALEARERGGENHFILLTPSSQITDVSGEAIVTMVDNGFHRDLLFPGSGYGISTAAGLPYKEGESEIRFFENSASQIRVESLPSEACTTTTEFGWNVLRLAQKLSTRALQRLGQAFEAIDGPAAANHFILLTQQPVKVCPFGNIVVSVVNDGFHLARPSSGTEYGISTIEGHKSENKEQAVRPEGTLSVDSSIIISRAQLPEGMALVQE